MTNQLNLPPDHRVNISLKGEGAIDIEELRILLERRLKQRLSIAQVIKRATKIALAEEIKADR